LLNLKLFVLSQIGFRFVHRVSIQIYGIGVVNQPIQDGIGQGSVADNFMPVIHRQLTGNQRGVQAVVIFKDF